MMQTLRKYMKHVMWIVAVAFIGTIIFSWGMGGFKTRRSMAETGVVGSINGDQVMYQQFAQMVEDEVKRVREQEKTEDLSEYRRSAIRDQAWQQLVREKLLSLEVQRQKIAATPEEIVFYMRNSPPDFVRSAEQFQTNGAFDPQKYQDALSDQRNFQAWIPVENYFRSVIPLQKLQQNVIATVRVSEAEALDAWRMDNEKVNVKYVFFDPSRTPVDNPMISEDAVKKYYKSHEKEYREPELRKIRYASFEIKPTAEDSSQTRSDCMDIIRQLRGGADFSELAKEYSEDKSNAENGGDLGFIAKGSMVKPFEDAAFGAKIGEIVGPVQTPFGLHVLKVSARKKEKGEIQVQARHILLTYKTSQESIESINNRAEFFADEVQKTKGKGFEEIASQENVAVKETAQFRKGGFIPGIGLAARVNHLAFSEKKGWVSQPVSSDPNVIVFQIIDIQKERIKPLADVKASIEDALRIEKQKASALAAAGAFRQKLQAQESLESLAAGDSLAVQETGFFSALGYIPVIGRDMKFSAAAFKLKPGEISQPVEGARGAYIIRLMERQGADPQKFEAEKASFMQTLLQRRQNQYYSAWFKSLMGKADIKDYRDLYF
jgi:peptidyl-prolyl cis-trans isomerase D